MLIFGHFYRCSINTFIYKKVQINKNHYNWMTIEQFKQYEKYVISQFR